MEYQKKENPRWKKRFFTIVAGQTISIIGSSAVQFSLIWWLGEYLQYSIHGVYSRKYPQRSTRQGVFSLWQFEITYNAIRIARCRSSCGILWCSLLVCCRRDINFVCCICGDAIILSDTLIISAHHTSL